MSKPTLSQIVESMDKLAETAAAKLQLRADLKHEVKAISCELGNLQKMARGLAHVEGEHANIGDIVVDDQGIRYRVTKIHYRSTNIGVFGDEYNFDRMTEKCGVDISMPSVDEFLAAPSYSGYALTKDGKPTATEWMIRGKVKVIRSTIDDEAAA